jgi:two-component system, cell cycle response regulator
VHNYEFKNFRGTTYCPETMSENPGQEALPRVLIVDDSRIVRATIIKHLKGRYEFREETDGEAGWEALVADETLDVVLTDLSMPRLDGYGLIQRIRASNVARIKRLPVVLISGEEDESSRQRAKEIGATDFITKGIGTTELLSRLDSLITLTKAQEELNVSREQQMRDPATGLFSTQYIDEQSTKVFAFATRHNQPATILVVGIDGLEKLAQQYGEAVAVQLYQRFGQLLAGKVRKDDSLGQFGKEGFVALSPATPDGGALVFAERLREAVESANVVMGGKRLPITVSIGFSTVPADSPTDAAAWIALAGQRMRRAASEGGNRIVGLGNETQTQPRLPTIENALAILRAGRHEELAPHAGELAQLVLPILQLANDTLKLGLPMSEIEKRVQERVKKE